MHLFVTDPGTMRKKLYTFILFFLIVSSEFVFGKDSNKAKTHSANRIHNHFKEKSNIERLKRSLDEEDEKPFWANRGKKQFDDNHNNIHINANNHEKIPKILKERDMEDEPFWGTRGRRENYVNEEYPEFVSYDHSNCKNCYKTEHIYNDRDSNLKSTRNDNVEPFWGVRGRRDSNQVDDSSDPFWGTRGRRKDEPFWGSRGRRDDEPFWGNRGRRDDNEPFWGNRGRRQDLEPFWGTRGRRQESEPFWGSRGRRDDEPFWGNRGRRKDEDVFWGARGRRKEDLKESILNAINDVENDINYLSRLKKSEGSFWSNRGRDSKLKSLFSGSRSRIDTQQVNQRFNSNIKNKDPGTLTNSRIYADEPNYILVERTSRSSGEAYDPFYITRGKKYYLNYKLFKAARDRRGALEEIVKSVRNDPYYIARGKKDDVGNSTSPNGELSKVKELICSAVNLINVAKTNGKVKREIDSDRDRRTILKKLTDQLQNDPYFVSRGKKSENTNNDEYLREFITEIAEKC